MCGLNGIFSKHSIDKLNDRLEKMNNSIIHRGPDAGGKYLFNRQHGGLAHRRLSIIDLESRSNQPMISNSGNFIIAYNGEIFNYQKFKTLLDYDFKTNSDTEVILASLEKKNLDWFLANANGMFAFAIYDKAKDQITLARDRFGIKPLFYTITNDILVFSSEIKGILESGLYKASMRMESIDEYLGYRHVRQPFTFFENLYQLKCGDIMTFDSNINFKVKSYYSLPPLNFEKKYDEVAIIEELHHHVYSSVKSWLIADVKVGAYLSGGVDSSLITAIVSELLPNSVDTYTIGFKEEAFNEFIFAREVAELYKSNHREITIDNQDYIAAWDRLIYFKDAPLGVPNEIPLAIMSSRLSKDITVVLSGEGADELFGGYGRIYRLPFDYSNHTFKGSFYEEFIQEYEYVPRTIRDKYLTVPNSREFFDENIGYQFKHYTNEENVFKFFHENHIQGLLHRVDMTTMQTSVEARPPFLDHELIDFVYRQVPYDLKLKWNSPTYSRMAKNLKSSGYSEKYDTPKYALKQVAKKYLPADIINRKKVGFPVPLTNWFTDISKLTDQLFVDCNWMDVDKLSNLSLELESNPRSGQLLWMFLNVEKFRKMYFNKSWEW